MADKEIVKAIVKSETKTGQKGQYEVKYIEINNKQYNVSKKDSVNVVVGTEYSFSLATSEYNGKSYFWANLEKSLESTSQIDGDKVKAYFLGLDKEKQKNMIKWMFDNLKG